MKVIKKERMQSLPFVPFFKRHFRVLFLEHFSARVVGICQRDPEQPWQHFYLHSSPQIQV
jgi:hypothetical protein